MSPLIWISVFGLFHPTRLEVKADRTYELNLDSRLELPTRCFVLSVPGRIERQYCGALKVRRSGGELLPLVGLTLEAATAAAVAAEMPDGPPEAIKAQTILVRSFYAAGPRHGDHFCDTTHCQYMRGPGKPANDGFILTYQGKPFAPLYSASCGGKTFAAIDVGMREEPYPYFPVDCAVCAREAKAWERRVSTVPPRNETIRVRTRILPSNFFRAEPEGDGFVLYGRGAGHGVGLCQRGAIGLAKQGLSFREILEYYLPNTALWDHSY